MCQIFLHPVVLLVISWNVINNKRSDLLYFSETVYGFNFNNTFFFLPCGYIFNNIYHPKLQWLYNKPLTSSVSQRQLGWFACVAFNQHYSVCTPFLHYGWGTSWTTNSPFVLLDSLVTSQEKLHGPVCDCTGTLRHSDAGRSVNQTCCFFALLYRIYVGFSTRRDTDHKASTSSTYLIRRTNRATCRMDDNKQFQ